MPKETFIKLNEEKRTKFIHAFMREFSIHIFDEASISRVVKELGIAKGSVYQYFDSKLDLFFYLQQRAGEVKASFIGQILREDFSDFWTYFKALYIKGIDFDLTFPLESNFLHSLLMHLESPSIKPMYNFWLKEIMKQMEAWVRYEVEAGHFRSDISIESMAFTLHKMSTSLIEYMRYKSHFDLEEQIKKGRSIYAGENKTILLEIVDEYIAILSKAFNK